MTIAITATYAAILALLLAVLSVRTVLKRVKADELWSTNDTELFCNVRAHGNLIEYAPIFLILLAFLEINGTSAAWLHLLGLTFVAARLVSTYYFLGNQALALRGVALFGSVIPIALAAILLLIG